MIKRELYTSKVRPFIDTDIVKVMTGIRRSGKSVLLTLIKGELIDLGKLSSQIISMNCESKRTPTMHTADEAYEYLKTLIEVDDMKKYLLIDEIQELEHWETLVNALMIDFQVDIYLTGSNAKLLSSELSTYLGGRYIEIKVYPFSYLEVLDIVSTTQSKINEQDVFLHYLQYGGMPFIYENLITTEASIQYLQDVFDSIVIKDVATRNNIRDIDLFKKVLLYFISNIAHMYSATSIHKYLKSENRKISIETLYNYIDYCKEACFLHLVQRDDVIGKKVLQFQEKIYMVDHGFREAIFGSNTRDVDQVLENIVYMELLRRGYDVYVGKNKDLEIDFVAKKGKRKIYIQVAYLLASDETIEREFRALRMNIMDNYPKYVLSMDEIDRSQHGIQHMNIRKFLMLNQDEL